MTLTAGTRPGPYEVLAPLGAGGMGEVYRAHDAKLDRPVAIKILPESFAHDPERLARFEREARTLASLNHPNIAIIHGFEEAQGIKALVMELVEGSTLADRIAQGPIPFDEAIPLAKQIAEALEAAHEQGIVHRDLKPANIKVREDGRVKVLDFGLAKLTVGESDASAAPSTTPTITSPLVTRLGVILGTAAYMSPEQAKGRQADKRSDLWAFGCVFYEMLTGRRAFDGEDLTDTIASVVKSEPDWSVLPADVPPPVCSVLKRCLERGPPQARRRRRRCLVRPRGPVHSPASSTRIGQPGHRRGIAAVMAAGRHTRTLAAGHQRSHRRCGLACGASRPTSGRALCHQPHRPSRDHRAHLGPRARNHARRLAHCLRRQ